MRKFFTLLLLIFAVSFTAKSALLFDVPQIVVQPNGDTIHLFASGDEFFNRLHDENGFTIIQGDDGWFYYAEESNGRIVASPHKIRTVRPQEKGLKPNLRISGTEHFSRRDVMVARRAGAERIPNTIGVIDAIAIYIRFSDDPEFTRESITQIQNNFNSDTNSLRNYFRRVSYGKLDIRTTHIPANPLGSQITSFVASQPRNHFRPHNETTNPAGYRNDTERQQREWQLLRDAINWARTYHSHLLQGLNLDNNGDGFADMVNFVIQGSPEGWSDLLWPHKWALQTVGGVNFETYITNNIRVRTYTFNIETQTSVRVLSHEAFHVLGAPDLYHYNEDFRHLNPVGRWDIMEHGAGHMLTHMKIRYGGWISDVPVITEAGTFTLLPQGRHSTRNVFRIDGNSQEHFLLEHRQLTDDVFEMNLPGSGLIVTRINRNMTGNAQYNATSILNEVYVLRPGGSVGTNGAINNANLSDRVGRTGVSRYHATRPFFSNGTTADFTIFDIVDHGDSITFSFLPRAISDPTNFSGRWRGESNILDWTPNISQRNVVLIYDTMPISDVLVNGVVYNVGDTLPFGAVVLFSGNDSLFIHTPITYGRTYYYKLFTNENQIYLTGIGTRVQAFLDTIIVFDTINNFLPNESFGAWTYAAPNTGFISGHNSFGHYLFVESFRNSTTRRVVGLFSAIARAVDMSSGAYVHLHVWDVGPDGFPGRKLTNEKIPYSALSAGRWNILHFENPPIVESDFFIGFSIEYRTPMDTFALFTTDPNVARVPPPPAYIRHNGDFVRLSSFVSNFNAGFAIEPILSSGGPYLTTLPQWLNPPAEGAQNLRIDVHSTFPYYEVFSNYDWISFSVDRVLDRIFINVEPADADRIGEIWVIAENDTSRIFIFQGTPVSVQKSEELTVILFPNPSFDGIFYLQSDGGEMQLDVFDMMGRRIWSRRTFSSGEKIDLSNQRSGMYILRIIKNGQQKTFRLIRQ
ncbi:MAG: M6 family metalloprotease domain-containing protein [Bacteroidales bacterium]|nr:M6 family metalloprotease domain-containing protein [Bacteroidales bacterium]